jgi:hypothetical protein
VSVADRVEFEVLAQYNPATPEERKAMHKPAGKSASEQASRPRERAIRPLPLPVPGLGRPPYNGPSQPMRPASGAPGSVPSGPVPSGPASAVPYPPGPDPTKGFSPPPATVPDGGAL